MAKVLVVEDEPGIRGVLEQALVRFGHDVVTAEDGFDALKKLSLGRTDLVITDIVMPEMDGVKLIQHIRERYPKVKIIAMSGGGGKDGPEGYLRNAKELGAAKCLTKPFMLKDLSSMVQKLLVED